MKALTLFVLILVAVVFAQRQDGVLTDPAYGSHALPWENGIRAIANWYNAYPLIGSVDTGVITIATKWDTTRTMLCYALYNNSAAISTIRIATAISPTPGAGDTIRLKLNAYSCSPKLPSLSKIIRLASTDTLIAFVQVQK
jgi:hypothetical protein